MTYSLPFGLKQKPLTKYFKNGVIRFSVLEGKLFFSVKVITRLTNGVIQQSEVKSKEHLDKLLSIKSWDEIPTIDCVVPNLREDKQ